MSQPLDSAPEHVKLAVDLIMILEQHELPASEVLQALEIVKSDYQNKLHLQATPSPNKTA